MVSRSERESNEARNLHTIIGYLDSQNEFLDRSDLGRLDEFLERSRTPLKENWARVISALQVQSERDPRSKDILTQLQIRVTPVEDAISSFKRDHDLRSPLAIFVGAGGSAPAPTSIPTLQNLLPTLWQKAGEIGNKPLLRLQQQCESLGISNIEDLLSAIYMAQGAVGNTKITSLLRLLLGGQDPQVDDPSLSPTARARRQRTEAIQPTIEIVESLRESLQTLFSVLVGMMVGKAGNRIHNGISEYCKRVGDVTIITTNYDVCIESALGQEGFTYDVLAALSDDNDAGPQMLSRVLKLHGSLNWYACLSCDRPVTARLDAIDRAYADGLYPVIAICRECQATAQQLIVPPITQKYQIHPMLLDVRQAAELVLRQAKTILVVGYSFTETDEYILRMFSRAVESDADKDIIVLDIDSAPGERFHQFLATHSRNYDSDKRLFKFVGDAEQTLPTLFRGPTEGTISSSTGKPKSRKRRPAIANVN